MQDLEYLQQMYPAQVQRCRKRITCLLDRLDYEGSMIYDEYPDRCSLQNFVATVKQVLDKEEENPPAEELIQVLVFLELVKRREGKRKRTSFYLF